MGRRRLQKAPITSINIYVTDLDTISKLKNRRETQYGFIRRLLAEWQDLRDYRLDMDQVIRLKDRQISNLEYELKERLTSQPNL
ncbi:MAG: hypothetical protein R3321_13250 [Nitrososphaeraceae archaeon]|nr:hypothetical protein [Nitrososphaeraceae archaeon]